MEVEDIETEQQAPLTENKEEKEKEETKEEEEEVEEEVPKKSCRVGTSITKDKIETILFAWVLSLHVALIVRCLFGCTCWKLIFITCGFGATIAILAVATYKITPDGRPVLVTGCDSGFGHALALKLDALGFTVIACCLSDTSEGAVALKTEGSENLHVLKMNVCNEEEILQARKEVDKIIPEGGLWGLVNNAGVSTFGELEWVPVSTYKKLVDVNVLGMVSVTKAFLPLIRKAKGRVVNVSSMLGRMGGPMRSPYVITKYGVEGLTECLRHEMKPWGVHVILLEPGNFVSGTSIFTEESINKMSEVMWTSMSEEVRADYEEQDFKSKMEVMKSYITGGVTDISPVITAFIESLTQEFPQARYRPVGWNHRIRMFVSTHLPECIYDYLYVGAMNK